ncbi:uncharacterized protein C19orf47 [Sitodiplosis mosellana]|uniref:uncharacterized protein C19orf47 n=1 Tax=Sitodiplosis mosellana TaxID=263140 RepID=UPI0024448B50|nr:uncharacterized protein C19orf47 [Sitodiplosis mosellana]
MVASANLWVKFFQAAGVPSQAAATYAHIFYENRMDLDMLTDLNKEYLREMGITPMGDIISILRHAKKVNEQNTRDKILSAEKASVTTASVSPLLATTSKKIIKKDEIVKSVEEPARKPARRVLPEHEGRYKITLPSGSTERSKQILEKQALLYSDKEEKKLGIFDRLEQTKKKSAQPQVKVTGLNSVPSTSASSIFSRLGGKSDDLDLDDEKAVAFAGILKSAPKKIVSIKKASKPQQKAILVKRIPAKAATMVADEYERMETGEKSVKFSNTDEILEIESRKKVAAHSNKIRLVKADNIRARLGLTVKNDKLLQSALLHRTKKIVKLKQPVKRANGQPLNVSTMKSDEDKKSVKSRIGLSMSLKKGPDVSKLANRVGRVSLGSRLGTKMKNGNQNKIKSQSASSVFDRLGFNKK